jgi:hypothetical protein
MSYTTDDCKNYLINLHNHTKKSEWKRVRKYNNTNSEVCREFLNHEFGLTVFLKETKNGLVEFNETVDHSKSISETLFGGGITSSNHLSSYEDKFLHVLENGIDWDAPRKKRSSFDFAKKIDFDSFIQKQPELLYDYLEYMSDAISFVLDLDETYISGSILVSDNEDSFVDVFDVLNRIVQAYNKINKDITGNADIVTTIIQNMDEATSWMDCNDNAHEEEQVYITVQKISDFLQQLI